MVSKVQQDFVIKSKITTASIGMRILSSTEVVLFRTPAWKGVQFTHGIFQFSLPNTTLRFHYSPSSLYSGCFTAYKMALGVSKDEKEKSVY